MNTYKNKCEQVVIIMNENNFASDFLILDDNGVEIVGHKINGPTMGVIVRPDGEISFSRTTSTPDKDYCKCVYDICKLIEE